MPVMKGLLPTLSLLAVGCSAALAQSPSVPSREDSVRGLIRAFAEARNAHDGAAAVALYAEDGEWVSADGWALHSRPEISKMWTNAVGHVDRTILSMDFPGPNMAVVRVETNYGSPIGLHSEVFILIHNPRQGWRIHVHQTLD
jgi:hypothetical protein